MLIQITLNEKNPAHAPIINHLKSLGRNSGEPKRLLLQGWAVNNDLALINTAPDKTELVKREELKKPTGLVDLDNLKG